MKDPANPELVAQVGNRFATMLKDEIGAINFATVKQRNATETYKGACASHDFCDANTVMDAAIRESLNLASNHCIDVDFWNHAWNYARAKHLS